MAGTRGARISESGSRRQSVSRRSSSIPPTERGRSRSSRLFLRTYFFDAREGARESRTTDPARIRWPLYTLIREEGRGEGGYKYKYVYLCHNAYDRDDAPTAYVFSTFSLVDTVSSGSHDTTGLALLSGPCDWLAVRESGRLFSARVCDTRRMRAEKTRRRRVLIIDGRRSSLPAAWCPIHAAAASHTREILGSLTPGAKREKR